MTILHDFHVNYERTRESGSFVYKKDLTRKHFVFYNNVTAGTSGNKIIFFIEALGN